MRSTEINYPINIAFQNAILNPEKEKIYAIKNESKPLFINDLWSKYYAFIITIKILRIILEYSFNPFRFIPVALQIFNTRKAIMNSIAVRKFVKVNGKIYWNMFNPGYGSSSLNDLIRGEIRRMDKSFDRGHRINNAIVGITKKCPLQCEHCFEWKELNKKETLSTENLEEIVGKLEEHGTSIIQLSGGEPMRRLDDILGMLKSKKGNCDIWILSSGFGLSPENCRSLARHGLTGVAISLDHYEESAHNAFRGTEKAYKWATEGARNASHAGLAVTLSLCPTREFVSKENLLEYAELAKDLGAAFIQIIEPKAVGHYEGKDVLLKPEQHEMLEEFFLKLNNSPEFHEYPIVSYHGQYQRRLGCFGSGERSLYVDTDGNLMPCPFCRKASGNLLKGSAEEEIEKLRAMGCGSFPKAKI